MTGPAADICIIGAGSSGIAVAKALHDKGLNFDIYEKGSNIGALAVQRLWRRLDEDHSSRKARSLCADQ